MKLGELNREDFGIMIRSKYLKIMHILPPDVANDLLYNILLYTSTHKIDAKSFTVEAIMEIIKEELDSNIFLDSEIEKKRLDIRIDEIYKIYEELKSK